MTKAIAEFANSLTKKKTKREEGEFYCFFIAIDDYENELELSHCKRDSEYLINTIINNSSINFKHKNIYKLYDKEATKLNIYNQLRYFNKILTSKDQLVFHIGTHSKVDLNTNFFIPYDGDKSDVHSNISSQIIRSFIADLQVLSCTLILNTYDPDQPVLPSYKDKIDNLDKVLSSSKTSVFSDLINFLQKRELNTHKSVWHFTKTTSSKYFEKGMAVYEDNREIKKFNDLTKSRISECIDQGEYKKALEEIARISKNNDPRIRDQTDSLLSMLEQKRSNAHLATPLKEAEIEGLTKSLVHQVHECGYYLVPSPKLLKEEAIKSKSKIILYVSADASDQSRLRLDEEYRAINVELQRSTKRDEFELIPALSSRISDLQKELLDRLPYIVHFSGHGSCQGICLVANEAGITQIVENGPLGGLFQLFSNSINCVFLNSCYSQGQSESIGEHIKNVICMSNSVQDITAIKFASAFYMSLGSGKDVPFSFQFAKNSIDLHGCEGKEIPILINNQTA